MSGSDAVFAGYRLEQRIVTDTVSTTYRAISQTRSRQRRPVALRITEPLDTTDTDMVASFLGALDGAAAVRHPALATIHDVGEADSRLYVATDLVAGTTLDELISHHGPLPAGDAVAVLWPIAEGLDHAHAAGVVHGAVSPRTIFVSWRRTEGALAATLTGFGLDTLLARRVRTDRDRIDVLDVCYVAPEQLGGGDADARVDQYALACALYHCVAGRPPYVRDTVAAMFGAHLFSEARVPAGRDGDGSLGAAVATGMAKRPDDRHASCAALMRATGHVRPADRHARVRSRSRGVGSRRDDSTRRGVLGRAAARPGARATRRRRGSRRRARRRRLPISWPVAAMLVLAGIICTLLFAAMLAAGDSDDATGAAPVVRHVAARP